MTKEEILNGMSEEEFYDMYPTQEAWENSQQMKLGGLSGAPHNGQPTADEFFSYGSHVNDELNIPMSNPFYAANGGTPYYGGPIRPYAYGGGLQKYQGDKQGSQVNPWQTPGSTHPDDPNFIHSTTPGSTRWVTKEGKTPFQELLSKPKMYGSGKWTGQDTLIHNDPRLFDIEKAISEKPEYKSGYWGAPILRDLDEVERAKAYEMTYGAPNSLINRTGTAKGTNPDPYDQMYYDAIKRNDSGTAKPVSKELEQKLRYYSKAKKYGGYMDMGGNTASPMNYGAFNIPMQYGGYEEEYGGVIDPGNNQDYPILEEGGKSALMDIIKAHSKKMRKAYQEGGDTVMQGGNSTDEPTKIRERFKSVLKRNIQNHMINEEEKAFSNPMMNNGQMDMGGFAGPGMNYGATNFSQHNQQNQALANMYQQRISATQDNLKNDFNNLGNATNYLGYTANPYQKTSIKAKYGATLPQAKYGDWDFSPEYQKSQRRKQLMDAMRTKMGIALNNDMSDQDLEDLARKEGLITDKAKTTTTNTNTNTTNTTKNDSNNSGTSDYNKYFSQDKKNNYYYGQGTRGTDYFPMNYNPYTKISKTDVAKLKQIAATPTSGWQFKEFNHRHFGPWGKTKMKFGYRDEITENKVDPALIDPTKKQIIDEMAANPNMNLYGPGLNPNMNLYGPSFQEQVRPLQAGPLASITNSEENVDQDNTPKIDKHAMMLNSIFKSTNDSTSNQPSKIIDKPDEATQRKIDQFNKNNPSTGFDFPGKMPPQDGPRRIEGRDYDFDRKYQDGGFSRVGPQGQTVEMMMNPFNHGNTFADNDEEVSEVANEVASERYYPETMNPIQVGMPQMVYEDQEADLASILNDVPNPARVSYRNTSDDKPKIVNREDINKVKSEAKPVKGVQTPIKKAPAPKTLPVKPKVGSSAPMPGVNSNLNTNKGIPQVFTPPAKKLTQNTVDTRQSPQTGVVVDKKENIAYYIGDKKQSGSFPVLTGANVKANYNPYNVTQLGNNPNLRSTPVGYYKLGLPALSDPEAKKRELLEDNGAKGKEGSWMEETMKSYKGKYRDMEPISAFGQAAPVAANLGFHRAFSNDAFNPKDPEFVRRIKLLNSQNPNMRCTTYGCVNAAEASYDEIARVFPTSDTLMVLDSNNPLDAEILRQFKIRAKQKKYGGLTRAQYGIDHKSTNPADGTYDNFGNPIGLSSATGNMGLASSNLLTGNQGIYSNTDTSFKPSGNAPGAAPISFEGAPKKTTPTPESVGLQQKNVEMKGMGTKKELEVTKKDRPGFDREAMANWSIAGINTLAGGLEQAQNAKNQKQLSNLQLADNAFVSTPANAQSRGDYDPNSGMFRMDQMNPVQFPGGIGYSAYGGAMYQEGGMQEEMQPQPQQAQPDPQQIMEGVAAMLQQGAQPEQVAQQLVEMGIPQEQVMQIIQAVMQQMQGGQEQAMQPAMRYGGYAMGGYQDNEDSYEDDLDEDEIEELKRQGYNVEYLD